MMTNTESVFDSLAREYDSWFDNEGRLIFKIEAAAFQDALPVLPKPWLEVGVGSGRFAQALRIATGIDPSMGLIRIARRRGVNVFLANGEDSFFDKETFGAVFLIVTLCFVNSPADVLREAYRILERNGKLAIGLVLRDSPWGQFYQNKKRQGHRFYSHATFYNFEEVKSFLENTGFAIEQVLSTLFQKPGEVKRMEEPKQGLYEDAGFVIIIASKKTGEALNQQSSA